MLAMLVFTNAIYTYAGCNAPPGETCTFSLSAKDANDSTRVASDGGTLQMVGVSRAATLTATAEDPATFDAGEPSWSNGSTGSSVSHAGGSADYTATAFGTSKSISIEQKSASTTTISLGGNAGFKTIAASLNSYATTLGIGVTAQEPTITGSYKWKYVDLKNSPNVKKHHTVTIDCSAGLNWDEIGLPGLSKTIDLGVIEILCGVYSGGNISVSLAGAAAYDPNPDENGENTIEADISGTATLKLQGSCAVETWYLKAGAGAEVSGNFSLGASASATINNSGISSSEAKLTYGVSLEGKAYAYFNGANYEKTWTYAPSSLQGEAPFSFGYNY